jgi:hypothetical protein
MANTFVKIQTVTVGSGGAATIDFNSIPQTYTDLVLVASLRRNTTGGNTWVKFNSISTAYTAKQLYGYGTGTGSSTLTNDSQGPLASESGFTASIFSNCEMYMPNYTSSNYKTSSINSVTENNATTSYQNLMGGLWSNTAAITSMSIVPTTGNIVEFSTATLYGIKSS